MKAKEGLTLDALARAIERVEGMRPKSYTFVVPESDRMLMKEDFPSIPDHGHFRAGDFQIYFSKYADQVFEIPSLKDVVTR